MDERVRVIVIGAGPAGAASGIFLKRAGIEPLLIEERRPGGLLHEANLVENYPGFPEGVPGKKLAALIGAQLNRLNVRVLENRVTAAEVVDGSFRIMTEDGAEYSSDALVVATGTTPKKTAIPGAAVIEGRRLFYEISTIDEKLIGGNRIAILGGGDAAYDYAINLCDRGGKVTIVSRSAPTCLGLLMERARKRGVEALTGHVVTGITETDHGVAVACESGVEERKEVVCDMVLVAHGREPRLDMISPELRKRMGDEPPPSTGVPGLFVAGDVARGIHRQAAIAAGDGVLAAMMIQRLLKERGECA